MDAKREAKVRMYLSELYKWCKDVPSPLGLRMSNKLDKISLELKKDRENYNKPQKQKK